MELVDVWVSQLPCNGELRFSAVPFRETEELARVTL